MDIRKVSIITTLTALCVATNYALVGVHNVKITDFIVFIGGLFFGPLVGAFIGILSWAVYGAINPYGFVPQIWLATMFCETIYGLFGGLVGKNFALADFDSQRLRLSIFFGIIGFISTLIYDLVTNIVYALTFNIPIIVAVVFGTPFTLLHELSNTAIFILGSVPLIIAMKSFLGVEKIEEIDVFAK
jgi:uncharacterized membrane protein